MQEWVSASNTTTWTLKSSTEEFPRMSKAFSRGSVLLFISRRIAQSHLAFMLVFVTIPTQYISHSLASFLASAPICEPHIHTTPSQTQLNNNIITEMLFSCRRHFGSVSKNSSKAGRRAMCNFWMHGTKGERHESWTRFFLSCNNVTLGPFHTHCYWSIKSDVGHNRQSEKSKEKCSYGKDVLCDMKS